MNATQETQDTSRPIVSMEEQLAKMREDWDRRATENARHYVQTEKMDWTDEDFFLSGELTVKEQILTDMTNICRGIPPEQMTILEIGCGAGRVTRALATIFGEVHAVDISAEMARLARKAVKRFLNVSIYQNNGLDLSVIPVHQNRFCVLRSSVPAHSKR